VLVESRVPRRAAIAYCRSGHSVIQLAQGMQVTRARAQGLLDGRYHWLTLAATESLLAVLAPEARRYVIENLRLWSLLSGKLPTAVVAPIIREAVAQEGSVTTLAHVVGVDARRLHAIVHEREESIGFEVADRIVSRSVGPLRWQEPDLRRWLYTGTETVLAHAGASNKRNRGRLLRELARA
jgi:hypothetical protein